jgi:hypothetical protein
MPCKKQYTEQRKISNERSRSGQGKNIKHHVLIEDKLDDTDTKMATSPSKSMCCLAIQGGVSKSSICMMTGLVKLCPYKN